MSFSAASRWRTSTYCSFSGGGAKIIRKAFPSPPSSKNGDASSIPSTTRCRPSSTMSRWMGSVLIALLAVVAIGLVPAAAADLGAAPQAYYLFLAGTPQGCEDCYVPLLMTQRPLGEVASSGSDGTAVLITTYVRDSIWKLVRDVSLAVADI